MSETSQLDDRLTPEARAAVRADCVRHVYRHVVAPQIMAFMAACLVAFVYMDRVPAHGALGWACLLGAVVFARWTLVRAFRRVQPADQEIRPWGQRMIATNIGTALVWASTVPLLLPWGGPQERMVLMVTVMGGSMGWVPIISPMLRGFLPMQPIAMLPFIIWEFGQSGEHHRLLGFILLMFLGLGLSAGIRFGRAYRTSLELRYRNLALIGQLRASRDAAEVAATAKSAFLANMSHEIRTPMNGVIGLIDILLQDKLAEAQRHQVETMRRSADSLLRIINDILDFARLESHSVQLEPAPFSLTDLVSHVESVMGARANAKGVQLATECPDGQWRLGDVHRIQQVLFNLVGNAIKFTDAGTVTVSVAAEAEDMLRFTVTDQGIGISPADQARLFHRFAQADASISRRFGGTGLGLAICRELVELMGGKIGVSSVEGQGSSFWFTARLPAADAPPRPVEVAEAPPSLPPLKVLVAEDNPVNQMIIRVLLEKAGHSLHLVGDGAAALAALEREHFDLVLMDIEMPGMDGKTAVTRLRASDSAARDIPVIALTAHAVDGHREEYLGVGMNDYVTKPIDVGRLFGAMGRVVGK